MSYFQIKCTAPDKWILKKHGSASKIQAVFEMILLYTWNVMLLEKIYQMVSELSFLLTGGLLAV